MVFEGKDVDIIVVCGNVLNDVILLCDVDIVIKSGCCYKQLLGGFEKDVEFGYGDGFLEEEILVCGVFFFLQELQLFWCFYVFGDEFDFYLFGYGDDVVSDW